MLFVSGKVALNLKMSAVTKSIVLCTTMSTNEIYVIFLKLEVILRSHHVATTA